MTAPSVPARSRRHLRFGLRTLLALMVVVAIPLAWKFNRLRAQRRVVSAAARSEAGVWYDYEMPEASSGPQKEPPGPAWLRALLGNDAFAQVVFLGWSDQEVGEPLFSDIAALPALRMFGMTHVTDDRLEQISGMSSLTHLTIEGDFTDAGVARLARLPKLETLSLTSPRLTARVMTHLEKFKSLGSVQVVSEHEISDEAQETLRRALPGCRVDAARNDGTDGT